VTGFHPVAYASGFRRWLADLLAAARPAPGFGAARPAMPYETRMDWARGDLRHEADRHTCSQRVAARVACIAVANAVLLVA